MIAHLWGAAMTHFGDLEAPFEDMVVQLGEVLAQLRDVVAPFRLWEVVA
jgi:hypothetical protein